MSARSEHLRTALRGHEPADPVEVGAVSDVLALLDVADPWSRTEYEPGHITGSAFVLHPSDPAVALILHEKIGRWLQPGGHVESEDGTVADTAVREVTEEIGVAPAGTPELIDVDIHTFPARAGQPRHLHFDVRWTFRAADAVLRAGDGAADVRWFPLDECLGMDESISRPAAKLIRCAPGLA